MVGDVKLNGVGNVRRAIRLILMAAALTIIAAGGFVGYKVFYESGQIVLPDDHITDLTDKGIKNRVSVLLIGADQRPEQTKFSTDTIILASVDPETRRASFLSIPRDTRVELAGHGYLKINEIVALTDLSTLQSTVEELTGVGIAGYVQTNFQGFKKIIDTLGGITVNVEKNMYYETGDDEDGYINLRKGEQHLDGTKALQYARFRHDALADISRTARQQVVLKAVAKEMFQLSTIPKLPFLIPQLMDAVNTNLSMKDILALAKVAVKFDSSNVISQTLPGSFLDLDGVSYWKVDPKEAKEVVQNLFQGQTTDKVINQEPVDLLKPVIPTPSKPLPQVPGNSQDPNGQKSPGYQVFQEEVEKTLSP
ncbi:cell envelope-related function transcriptional attenuator common domain protein [Desulfosporosinus orientis DSM 765]|uniref:Cell envelope-related function transcriptional attenuator common domain protein n=1 Tax=Desulfosporosinus orientis (strain ATCC 19365 / DSM 765 / NCIMB 8382 / VKM B-1628 / Singapore I) TaxID=768706 RepID=G7WHV9_DESOD|nr:LCP family protein [Desulfosporosinus orientis]AET70256.1 cell envelope-related function transcriptional attenuator common domain protein [Desulfosporosinus orientis DSM 765]